MELGYTLLKYCGPNRIMLPRNLLKCIRCNINRYCYCYLLKLTLSMKKRERERTTIRDPNGVFLASTVTPSHS